MSGCFADGLPPRLPANTSLASGRARSRMHGLTNASCTSTSACSMPASACSVSNPGSPGPAPMSQTWPGRNSGIRRSAASSARPVIVGTPQSDTRHGAGLYAGAVEQTRPLRRGWTTGTCATAAAKAAYAALLGDEFPDPVEVTLPRGERVAFALAETSRATRFGHGRGGEGCGRRPGRDPRRIGARDGEPRSGRQRREFPRRRRRRHRSRVRACRCHRANRRSTRCRGR